MKRIMHTMLAVRFDDRILAASAPYQYPAGGDDPLLVLVESSSPVVPHIKRWSAPFFGRPRSVICDLIRLAMPIERGLLEIPALSAQSPERFLAAARQVIGKYALSPAEALRFGFRIEMTVETKSSAGLMICRPLEYPHEGAKLFHHGEGAKVLKSRVSVQNVQRSIVSAQAPERLAA